MTRPVAGGADRPIFRFAPSPNGPLHLGHAFSALTVARLAEEAGGRFLLRVEDIDVGRCRPAFAQAIFDDLAWLGLTWEEPVLRQSTRFEAYRAAADALAKMGLLYPCFASRAEISVAALDADTGLDPDGAHRYPGLHKGLSAEGIASFRATGRKPAMRLDMQKAMAELAAKHPGGALTFHETGDQRQGAPGTLTADPARWGDAVIQRKDVPTSYHLAVVVDDAFQGVTHVVRGRDLIAATDIHRLLQWLLGFDTPIYHHHRVLLDPLGRKLSKSAASTSLQALRGDGMTADEMRRRLGF